MNNRGIIVRGVCLGLALVGLHQRLPASRFLLKVAKALPHLPYLPYLPYLGLPNLTRNSTYRSTSLDLNTTAN